MQSISAHTHADRTDRDLLSNKAHGQQDREILSPSAVQSIKRLCQSNDTFHVDQIDIVHLLDM